METSKKTIKKVGLFVGAGLGACVIFGIGYKTGINKILSDTIRIDFNNKDTGKHEGSIDVILKTGKVNFNFD